MAIFDVLNKKGERTGITKDSKQIFLNGDWHKASHVWIINSKKELLISRRSDNVGTYKGYWTMSAGGHVDAGETSLECAVRETEEELGVKFSSNQFKHLFTVPFKADLPDKKIRQFNDVFLVESENKINDYDFDKVEVTKVGFIYYGDLKKSIENHKIQFTPQFEQFTKLFRYIDKLSLSTGAFKQRAD